MNIDARADHRASTLKRCYSIALGILKNCQYTQGLKKKRLTPKYEVFQFSVIPYFKLLDILGFIRNGKTKQIKEIAEIHVMCDMT